jgi:hypothetical protein
MRPLFELAADGQLPRHQIMDLATACWIAQHAPSFLLSWPPTTRRAVRAVLDCIVEDVDSLFPSHRHYLSPFLAGSIHGRRHAARVGIYSRWLVSLLDVSCPKALFMASIFHDVRRIDDGADPGHGTRAAEYMELALKTQEHPSDFLSALAMARFHEVEWYHIPGEIIQTYGSELAVFKAADALDRFRLPKARWWPHPDKLLSEAHCLVAFAAFITVAHEIAALQGHAETDALSLALCRLQKELQSGQTVAGLFDNLKRDNSWP